MNGKDARPIWARWKSTLVAPPILALLIVGCGGGDDGTYEKTYSVAAHKEECSLLEGAPRLCLLVRESDTENWSPLAGNVDGFDYRRGHSYRIRVEVDPPPERVADAPNDYSLEEVLERSAVPGGRTFEYPLWYAADALVAVSAGLYEVYGEERISCDPADCASIDSLLTQDMSILFELRHPADPADPLQISQILCSASLQSFRSSCLD